MIASLQKQDLAHANKYFERALTNDTEEELLELADYLESIGFSPQASEFMKKLAPHYPEAYISLAQIASEDGQVEESFAYLEEITSDNDWYVTALLVKADLYQMEGLPDVAREKLAETKQLSDEPLVTFGLAEIDFELGHFNQAIKVCWLRQSYIYEQTGVSLSAVGVSYASFGKFEVAEFWKKL